MAVSIDIRNTLVAQIGWIKKPFVKPTEGKKKPWRTRILIADGCFYEGVQITQYTE
jgi:hypothetical protein